MRNSKLVMTVVVAMLNSVAYGYVYSDYTWFTYPANGHKYALTLGQASSWGDAEAQAVAVGGHLVTINDREEQDWLSTTFPYGEPAHPWIGLWQDVNDPDYSEPGGGWKWISGEHSAFRNWAGGEPNEAPPSETNEDRAQMNAFAPGLWQDVPGNAYQRGIIEVPEPANGDGDGDGDGDGNGDGDGDGEPCDGIGISVGGTPICICGAGIGEATLISLCALMLLPSCRRQ